jgi:hypothetical protein
MAKRHAALAVVIASGFVGAWAGAACGGGASDSPSPSAADGATAGDDASSTAGEDAAAAVDANATDAASFDAADAADAAPSGGLAPDFVFFDSNHVLSTGQSLSVGATGAPALSTAQPYGNAMFSVGVIAGGAGLTAFSPLVEASVETMSSGLANFVSKMAVEELLLGRPAGPERSHDILVSVHGVGGIAYAGLKKGTAPFANGIAQAKAGHDLTAALGYTHTVRVVTTVHGESDHIANNAAYEANLVEWQHDYETDVKAVTGQAGTLPFLQTQMSSWTKYGQAASAIPGAQLAAHVHNPGKIVLVGPKYDLEYAADGVHLSNLGYRHMGEQYAKAYRRVVLEKRAWEPLRPSQITRVGAVITVKFVVPAPPLVLDTNLVSDPGHYGFEYTDGSAPPAIASVALAGPDSVTVTLAAAPTGANKRLRYAYTGVPNASAGPKTGPRGNLRDADATASPNGYELFNWCVHFDEAVP